MKFNSGQHAGRWAVVIAGVMMTQPVEADDIAGWAICLGQSSRTVTFEGHRHIVTDAFGDPVLFVWRGPVRIGYLHDPPLGLH